MKSSLLILLALIITTPLLAATFELETSHNEPIYRTALPKEVYQYSSSDHLQDLTMTNAEGEAVPYALIPYHRIYPQTVVTEKNKPMVIFPMQEEVANNTDITAIQLNNNSNNTSIQVTSQVNEGKVKTYYLFDLAKQHQPFKKLTIDWEGQLGKLLTLDILTSDNLKDWQYAGEATLLKVTANNETILKNSVHFNQPINAQFLQIRPQNTVEPFMLKSANLHFDEFEETSLPIDWQAIPFLQRTQTDNLIHIDFESPGRFPVRYLDIQLPQQNTITSVTVLIRNNKDVPWRSIKSASLYNLVKEGKNYFNKPIQIPSTTARYWRLSFSNNNGGIGNKNPELSLGWLAETLIWNARGLGPYSLQVGEKRLSTSTMNINNLLKPYGNQQLIDLPSAPLKLVSNNQHFNAWETTKDHKRLWLWAGLVLGVMVLSGMAYSLIKTTTKE